MKQFTFFAAAVIAAATAAAALPVDLGTAGNFTILAKTGVSMGGATAVTGNIGLAPAAASYITGFGQTADSSNQFSTSPFVVGAIYAADYSPPTPTILNTAVGDMQTAYTDAAGRAAGFNELGAAGEIGGLVLAPGVYKWTSAVNISTDLTLSGDSSSVWIMQISQTLNVASGIHVNLVGGARAQNVFWQVAGQATLGTTSVLSGNVLGQTSIVFNTGATLNGKALAQAAVTLDAAVVTSAAGGYYGNNPPQAGQSFAYPSPVKLGLVNIVYPMKSGGEVLVKVWNENGDLVASQTDLKLAGTQKSQIPVAAFAPGVYLYKVFIAYDSGSSENLAVQKFAVAK